MSMTSSEPRRVRIMVLMGGNSSERPISLSTGRMILNALDPEKYDVSAIDTQDLMQLASPAPQSLPACDDQTSIINHGEHRDRRSCGGEEERANVIHHHGNGEFGVTQCGAVGSDHESRTTNHEPRVVGQRPD